MKIKHPVILSIILCLYILLSGCQVMYVPSMQNVPCFKQKKETQLAFSPTTMHIGYSLTDKLGLTLNGFYRSGNKYLSTGKAWDYRSDRYCVDLGFGGYFPEDDKFMFEIFSAIGYGYASLKYETEGPETPWIEGSHSNYYKIYTQPDFCFLTKAMDLTFSLRLSFLSFYNFQEYDKSMVDKQTNFFTEPALTFKFNSKYVNPIIQVQYSAPFSTFETNNFYYDVFKKHIIFSFGLRINLHEFSFAD
ncbi:MAG: hypothetical protein ISS19_13820 [Bacteroidales bacterium]|nr:hypothetical protein [Bacteroidales bacterium]